LCRRAGGYEVNEGHDYSSTRRFYSNLALDANETLDWLDIYIPEFPSGYLCNKRKFFETFDAASFGLVQVKLSDISFGFGIEFGQENRLGKWINSQVDLRSSVAK
jgi:hypothetical protein